MRRIIERVVTVVTTTTWKISWEPDLPSPAQPPDPISGDLPSPDVVPQAMYDTQVIETKEVDPPEREEQTTDQTAEEPLRKSYPYQTKNERKKRP